MQGLCKDAVMVLSLQWLGLRLFWHSERRIRTFAAILIGLGCGGASSLMRHSRLCRAYKGKATASPAHVNRTLAAQIM